MKSLLLVPVLWFVGVTGLRAECRTAYPVQVCTTIQSDSVVFAIRALEVQNETHPIDGFWLTGRVRLSDGSLQAIRVGVDRISWLGDNTIVITAPVGLTPVMIDHLNVSVRRVDPSAVLY